MRTANTKVRLGIFRTDCPVATAVDPIERIAVCPLGLSAHGTNLSPLHRKMDDTLALIEAQFADTTLAELVGDFAVADAAGALCPPPPTPTQGA